MLIIHCIYVQVVIFHAILVMDLILMNVLLVVLEHFYIIMNAFRIVPPLNTVIFLNKI